jgi:hypothetical protein
VGSGTAVRACVGSRKPSGTRSCHATPCCARPWGAAACTAPRPPPHPPPLPVPPPPTWESSTVQATWLMLLKAGARRARRARVISSSCGAEDPTSSMLWRVHCSTQLLQTCSNPAAAQSHAAQQQPSSSPAAAQQQPSSRTSMPWHQAAEWGHAYLQGRHHGEGFLPHQAAAHTDQSPDLGRHANEDSGD